MRSWAVLSLFFLILCVTSSTHAQSTDSHSDTGVIKGVVLDPQGAVVAGASIRATFNKTAETFTTVSADDGTFELRGLAFGDYGLLISTPGFTKFNTQVVLSKEAAESPHNTTLQVAMGETRIDVRLMFTGEQVTSCVVCGYAYFSYRYTDIPLKNRESYSLLTLQPGVVEHNGGFSISGRRLENKSSLVDGFDTRDQATGLGAVSLGLEALAEFNANYTNADTSVSSNYGQNSAPLLSAITKSGTNDYHGVGFWHLQRSGLNANNFFTNRNTLPRDESHFDQAGFTIGGNLSLPGVVSGKDRAFFLVSYTHTGDQKTAGRQIVAPLESFVERTAPIQGPLFRSLLSRSRIGLASSAAISVKDVDGDGLPDIGDAAVRASNSVSRNLAVARVDFSVKEKLQFELLYAGDKSHRLDDFNKFSFTPASPLDGYSRGDLAGLSFTALINASTVNDFRVGYLRSRTAFSGAGSDAPKLAALNTPLGVFDGLPEAPEQTHNRGLLTSDTFTIMKGAHTFRVGTQINRRDLSYRSDALSNGRIFYSDVLALVTDGAMSVGDPLRAIVRTELSDETENNRYRSNDVYLFAQDDWRASPRFVINYGLGYNRYSSVTYRAKTDRNNFAPFLSIAYAPTRSESFILRGGASIIYVPPSLVPYGEVQTTPLYPVAEGFAQLHELIGSPLPREWTEREGALEIEPEFSRDLRSAYTESMFFAVQHSIRDRLIVEIGYSGQFGHRLTRAYRSDRSHLYNAIKAAQYGSDEQPILIASDGNSNYHSLQIRASSRERRRITFQAHYTFSKAIDTVSDDRPSMFRSLSLGPVSERSASLERGLSDFDRRHRVVGLYQWRGPSLERFAPAARFLLGDWRVSGIVTLQSGASVTLFSGGDFFSGLGDFNRDGVLNDRIAFVGSGPVTRAIQRKSPADGYFDPRLFGPPANGGQPLGRNILSCPGYGSVDLAVHKKFSLTESHAFEVRADVFNAANRTNFAPPITNFASSDFGRSVEAGTARMIRMAVKYVF